MLTQDELTAWYEQLHLSQQARMLIDDVRVTDPARRVGGGHANVSGQYPSRKMGVTIHFESHRVELPTIREMEHDDQVVEFYDQPARDDAGLSERHGKASGRPPHAGFFRTP